MQSRLAGTHAYAWVAPWLGCHPRQIMLSRAGCGCHILVRYFSHIPAEAWQQPWTTPSGLPGIQGPGTAAFCLVHMKPASMVPCPGMVATLAKTLKSACYPAPGIGPRPGMAVNLAKLLRMPADPRLAGPLSAAHAAQPARPVPAARRQAVRHPESPRAPRCQGLSHPPPAATGRGWRGWRTLRHQKWGQHTCHSCTWRQHCRPRATHDGPRSPRARCCPRRPPCSGCPAPAVPATRHKLIEVASARTWPYEAGEGMHKVGLAADGQARSKHLRCPCG